MDNYDYVSMVYFLTLMTLAVLFILLVLSLPSILQSLKMRVSTGAEGLIHKEGEVIKVSERQLQVFVASEIWEAYSREPLSLHQKVRVKEIKGLTLIVEPVKHEKPLKG